MVQGRAYAEIAKIIDDKGNALGLQTLAPATATR
jgi:hypothetical protein